MPTKTTTKSKAPKTPKSAAKSSSTRSRAAVKPAKAAKTTENKGVASAEAREETSRNARTRRIGTFRLTLEMVVARFSRTTGTPEDRYGVQ